jgi:ribosomal protein S18 acetylase RimI-like enzyme
MSALDNPFWSSLTTTHARFAETHGTALRFPPDIAPFIGVERGGPLDPATLDALVATPSFLLGPEISVPAPFVVENLGVIVQMVCDRPLDVPEGPPIRRLDDRAAILGLAAIVYPHYFRERTMELGRFHGIGSLDAMIGERMAMPGLREISAVCTHPTAVGRGLARRLLAYASNAIFADGETPFLHVSPANTRALALYEQNGYRRRVDLPFWSLRRVVP